jgi:MFS family permease
VFLANQVTAATESGPRVNGLQVLKTYPRRVLLLMFVRAGSNVTFYTMSVYYLSYLTSQGVVSKPMAFTIIMVANGIAVCFSILGGLVSDAIGRKSVLYIAIAGQLIAVAAFLPAVHTGAALLIMVAVTLAVSSVQIEWGGAQAALYAEQFPTSMRFSGSALAMTFSQVLFSAPAPLVATAIASTGVFWAIPAVKIGVLLVSVARIPWLQDRRNVPLSAIAEPTVTQDVPYAQPESAPKLNATGR